MHTYTQQIQHIHMHTILTGTQTYMHAFTHIRACNCTRNMCIYMYKIICMHIPFTHIRTYIYICTYVYSSNKICCTNSNRAMY